MLVILINLLIDSFRLIYKKNNDNKKLYSEKAWLVSCFIIIICQLNDITYFDGKIGLLIWILLTGLKCILNENEKVLYNS